MRNRVPDKLLTRKWVIYRDFTSIDRRSLPDETQTRIELKGDRTHAALVFKRRTTGTPRQQYPGRGSCCHCAIL